MTTLIFGHQSPDTDAITCAITFAEYQRQAGNTDVEAVALGEPNAETKFALDYFKQSVPRVIKTAANETDSVMLVDHNEAQQSVPDRDQVTVQYVVDHHRVANFETDAPVNICMETLGSCNSVIFHMYKEAGFKISPQIAGLMASGLISDTLLLKSPTTTDEDRRIFAELQELAGIDLNEYGLKMLKAGTNLSARSDQDLIDGDAKSFDMNGTNVRIDQINTVDLNEIYDRQSAIQDAMKAEADKEGYDLFLVIATDILNSNSVGFVIGDRSKVEEALARSLMIKTGLRYQV